MQQKTSDDAGSGTGIECGWNHRGNGDCRAWALPLSRRLWTCSRGTDQTVGTNLKSGSDRKDKHVSEK